MVVGPMPKRRGWGPRGAGRRRLALAKLQKPGGAPIMSTSVCACHVAYSLSPPLLQRLFPHSFVTGQLPWNAWHAISSQSFQHSSNADACQVGASLAVHIGTPQGILQATRSTCPELMFQYGRSRRRIIYLFRTSVVFHLI